MLKYRRFYESYLHFRSATMSFFLCWSIWEDGMWLCHDSHLMCWLHAESLVMATNLVFPPDSPASHNLMSTLFGLKSTLHDNLCAKLRCFPLFPCLALLLLVLVLLILLKYLRQLHLVLSAFSDSINQKAIDNQSRLDHVLCNEAICHPEQLQEPL